MAWYKAHPGEKSREKRIKRKRIPVASKRKVNTRTDFRMVIKSLRGVCRNVD